MLSRPRVLPAGFIAPCLPIKGPQPPSGERWLHEIKHDGFRIIARKDGKRVKLYSRPGNDLTYRFPLIVEAIAKLRSRSGIIDGEAVACGEDGIASFDLIREIGFDPVVIGGLAMGKYLVPGTPLGGEHTAAEIRQIVTNLH
ncbi:MAG TPA: hypothetical protein VIH98_13530 [Xanthobacteraceae bacterium]|jgi:ATP-dependent DNA ligase